MTIVSIDLNTRYDDIKPDQRDKQDNGTDIM